MPHKHQVTGLHLIGAEWVSYTLNCVELPAYWAVIEASQHADQWLDRHPNLHALRRMAIMADAGAVRLLLNLHGQDREKEEQLLAQAGHDKAAQRAIEAARTALAYLACNPPQPRTQAFVDDPESYSDCESCD